MRRILGLFLALLIAGTTFAAGIATVAPVKPAKLHASEVLIPVGNGKSVSLLDLSEMKVRELEAITGKKMKFADRVGFKMAQRQLRQNINADGTINNRKLNKMAAKSADGSGFHLGGFALGFLLGLIGVLIAYLINDELKRSRVKWAWLGLGIFVVLYIILIVALI